MREGGTQPLWFGAVILWTSTENLIFARSEFFLPMLWSVLRSTVTAYLFLFVLVIPLTLSQRRTCVVNPLTALPWFIFSSRHPIAYLPLKISFAPGVRSLVCVSLHRSLDRFTPHLPRFVRPKLSDSWNLSAYFSVPDPAGAASFDFCHQNFRFIAAQEPDLFFIHHVPVQISLSLEQDLTALSLLSFGFPEPRPSAHAPVVFPTEDWWCHSFRSSSQRLIKNSLYLLYLSSCFLSDLSSWKLVWILSRWIQGSSFPSLLPHFHGGSLVTHKRCSMKFLWGERVVVRTCVLFPDLVRCQSILVTCWWICGSYICSNRFCASAQVSVS
jgi:hypothetical protein